MALIQPNQQVSALIAGKSIVTREVFQQMLPELQLHAFTIAGIECMDTLQTIRDRIADLPLGGDWDTIKKEIAADMGPWFDTEAAAQARAELLLRLHGFQAYSAGNHRAIKAHEDVFPFCQYVCTMDGRERDTHAALHGKVLPTNHPFWETHTGPWEWGCRCEKVAITREEAEEMGAEDLSGSTLPENVRVLDAEALARLETGYLFTGRPDSRGGHKRGAAVMFDVRTPKERGESEFEFRAGDVGMKLSDIEARYDAPVWEAWKGWAQHCTMEDGRTVWAAHVEREAPRAPRRSLAEAMQSAGVNAETVGRSYANAQALLFALERGDQAMPEVIQGITGSGSQPDAVIYAAAADFLKFVPSDYARELNTVVVEWYDDPAAAEDRGEAGSYNGRTVRLNKAHRLTQSETLLRKLIFHEMTHWLLSHPWKGAQWRQALLKEWEARGGEKGKYFDPYAAQRDGKEIGPVHMEMLAGAAMLSDALGGKHGRVALDILRLMITMVQKP